MTILNGQAPPHRGRLGVSWNDDGDEWRRARSSSLRGAHLALSRIFTPATSRAAGAYRAYRNRGEAFLKAGRPEAALRDFATALELEPGLPYASFNEGLAYIRLGQYIEALRAFNEE
jgi:tetratricopeptide (TPR) repeat protein